LTGLNSSSGSSAATSLDHRISGQSFERHGFEARIAIISSATILDANPFRCPEPLTGCTLRPMSRRRRALPQMPSALGEGRYKLEKPLGIGGMAVVYKCLDAKDNAYRAIKVLLPHGARNPKTRTRFQREARTMSALNHENIVRIYDIGDDDPHSWFVMELLEGGNLASFVKKQGRMPPARVLAIIIQMLRGLAHAHKMGVVHRDIKPHNMVFDITQRIVKLTDFGIARVLNTSADRITASGDTLGTLAYMAPEQRADPRNVGPVADVYGVGAAMYLLSTGRRPLELALADTDRRVLDRVPELLRPIVSRATEPEPEDRYPTAVDMAADVAHVLAVVTDTDQAITLQTPITDLLKSFDVTDS
jgi:serine/threonine protein kinase